LAWPTSAAGHLGLPCRRRKTLRALGERGDIIRTMQRAMRGEPREWRCSSRGTMAEPSRRVAAKGLADELRDRGYLVIDGVDGRAITSRSTPATNWRTIRPAVVEVKGSADVRAADKNITALASGAYTAPTITWPLRRAKPSPAYRRKSSRPTSAGWKPCAAQASWSAWPRGYGRCRTTWPNRAAAMTHSAWAAWPWN
jgi:hypothetical protein